MDRLKVLQTIIDRIKARTYLEIGVSAGNTFLRVRAPKKIALDPRFKMSGRKRLRFMLTNPCNRRNESCEMTSEQFFATRSHLLQEHGLDVAFVDGLHTYEPALRDVEHCLRHLNPGGVIVMHDCNPPSEAAAIPAASRAQAKEMNLPGANDEWCGDTYKAVIHLRSQHDQLRVFVIDADYGLGVVTRGEPESMLRYSPAQIAALAYADLGPRKAAILNLKPPQHFLQWIETL